MVASTALLPISHLLSLPLARRAKSKHLVRAQMVCAVWSLLTPKWSPPLSPLRVHAANIPPLLPPERAGRLAGPVRQHSPLPPGRRHHRDPLHNSLAPGKWPPSWKSLPDPQVLPSASPTKQSILGTQPKSSRPHHPHLSQCLEADEWEGGGPPSTPARGDSITQEVDINCLKLSV